MSPTLDTLNQAIQAKIEALRGAAHHPPVAVQDRRGSTRRQSEIRRQPLADHLADAYLVVPRWRSVVSRQRRPARPGGEHRAGRLPAGTGHHAANRRSGLCQRQGTLSRTVVGRYACRAPASGGKTRPQRAAGVDGACNAGDGFGLFIFANLHASAIDQVMFALDTVARPDDLHALPGGKGRAD